MIPYKIRYAFIGCLIVPVFMRLNIHGTGIEMAPSLFLTPFFVGGIAGFLIGKTKDSLLALNTQLESLVEKRTEELQKALKDIKTLHGIIPICAKCHAIRDDEGYWQQVDHYISEHTEAVFSHGMCKKCCDELYNGEDWYDHAKKTGEIPE